MLNRNQSITELDCSDTSLSKENLKQLLNVLDIRETRLNVFNLSDNFDLPLKILKKVELYLKTGFSHLDETVNFITEEKFSGLIRQMEYKYQQANQAIGKKYEELNQFFIQLKKENEELKYKVEQQKEENKQKLSIHDSDIFLLKNHLNKHEVMLKQLFETVGEIQDKNSVILDAAILENKFLPVLALLNTNADFKYYVLILMAQSLEMHSKTLTEKGAILTLEQLKNKTEEVLNSNRSAISQKYLKRLYQGILIVLAHWQKNVLGSINREINHIFDGNAITCLAALHTQEKLTPSLKKLFNDLIEDALLKKYQGWFNRKLSPDEEKDLTGTIAQCILNRWKMDKPEEFLLLKLLTNLAKKLFLQSFKEEKLNKNIADSFLNKLLSSLKIKYEEKKLDTTLIEAINVGMAKIIQENPKDNFSYKEFIQNSISILFQNWKADKLSKEVKEKFEENLYLLLETNEFSESLTSELKRAACEALVELFRTNQLDESNQLAIKIIVNPEKLKVEPKIYNAINQSALKTLLEKWKKQELSPEDSEFLFGNFNKDWQEYLHKINLLLNPHLQIEALQKQVTALQMQVEKLSSASNQDTKEEKQPSSTYSQAQLMSAHGILASNSKNESPASNENKLLENKESENKKMENS